MRSQEKLPSKHPACFKKKLKKKSILNTIFTHKPLQAINAPSIHVAYVRTETKIEYGHLHGQNQVRITVSSKLIRRFEAGFPAAKLHF